MAYLASGIQTRKGQPGQDQQGTAETQRLQQRGADKKSATFQCVLRPRQHRHKAKQARLTAVAGRRTDRLPVLWSRDVATVRRPRRVVPSASSPLRFIEASREAPLGLHWRPRCCV